MKSRIISVLNNFNEFPGLRHCDISDNSGEEFYHEVLNKEFKASLDDNEVLSVDLDRTDGYAISFLDEAFGNLVYDFSLDIVKKHINIVSTQEPHWKERIEQETYPQWENRRINQITPVVTKDHDAWFRLVGKDFICKKWVEPIKTK